MDTFYRWMEDQDVLRNAVAKADQAIEVELIYTDLSVETVNGMALVKPAKERRRPVKLFRLLPPGKSENPQGSGKSENAMMLEILDLVEKGGVQALRDKVFPGVVEQHKLMRACAAKYLKEEAPERFTGQTTADISRGLYDDKPFCKGWLRGWQAARENPEILPA